MNPIQAAVERPYTVAVGVILAVLFGVLALLEIPVQLKPQVDLPRIAIDTAFRGASAVEVEEQVTRELEDVLQSVEGLTEMVSTSSEGRSNIVLEFSFGASMRLAVVDVINKLSQVPNLPDETDEPVVTINASLGRDTVMWLVVDSGYDVDDLRRLVEEDIRARLERLPGVASVFVGGGSEREIQVRFDPDDLVARGLPVSDLLAALARGNVNVRGGTVETASRQLVVRTVARADAAEALADLIVKETPAGSVRLGDVAQVVDTAREMTGFVNINGKEGVALGVNRASDANVIDLVERLRGAIARINDQYAARHIDVHLWPTYVETDYIEQALSFVTDNLLLGSLLAVAVLLLFLRSVRSVLIVALSIPISLVVVFLVFQWAGRTLNVIALAGVAFASGMVVDNAIVVLENIFRHLEQGRGAREAAIRGGREVWGGVLASTLTTVAVFVPILMQGDEASELFSDMALAIASAVILSLLVALTVVPVLASLLYGGRRSDGALGADDGRAAAGAAAVGGAPAGAAGAGVPGAAAAGLPAGALRSGDGGATAVGGPAGGARAGVPSATQGDPPPSGARDTDSLPATDDGDVTDGQLGVLGRLYGRFTDGLGVAGQGRAAGKLGFVLIVMAVALASLALRPPAGYLPTGNRNLILFFAEPIPGTRPEAVRDQFGPFEEWVLAQPEADRMFALGGGVFNGGGVVLKEEHATARGLGDFLQKLYGPAGTLAGFRFVVPVRSSLFEDPGKQFEVELSGPDIAGLEDAAGRLQAALMQVPDVEFVRSSLVTGRPELIVTLDEEQAADLGLDAASLGEVVSTIVAGQRVSRLIDGGREVEINVVAPQSRVATADELRATRFVTPDGRVVSLGSVAEVTRSTGPQSIRRLERERNVLLTVNIAESAPLEQVVDAVERDVFPALSTELGSDYTLAVGGSADKLRQTLASLTGGFGLSVLIVYLLLVSLFRSWVTPVVILVTVPLALTGGLLGIRVAHELTGGEAAFDVIAMLGFVILAGLVVNNAILIVHQANNFVDQGHGRRRALVLAARSRLRPILMAAITTVSAMLPLALGGGAGAELYQGLGAIIVGGLTLSTLFTLFLVPVLLSLGHDLVDGWDRLRGRSPSSSSPGVTPGTPA